MVVHTISNRRTRLRGYGGLSTISREFAHAVP